MQYGGALARHYDALMSHAGYGKWADYLSELFDCTRVSSVLDMACGTGSLAYALAERGFDVIGVDASPDMLAAAEAKREGGQNPMFLCQKLWELDLYGTVDAAVCTLDSVNYITRPELLKRAIARAFLFLNPGGVLVFDARTPLFYQKNDGISQTSETPSCFCVWTRRFDGEICTARVDLFERSANLWARRRETHRQRSYDVKFLLGCLEESGFDELETFHPFKRTPPSPAAERVFFRARKPGG